MTKPELRKIYLAKREKLSESEYERLCRMVTENFFNKGNIASVNTLHIYLAVAEKKEADTWPILDRLKRESPHIRIVVPKMVDTELEHYYYEGLQQLDQNKFGIFEPTHGTPCDLNRIDTVVVPLLVADKAGHRLGYGRGFYDKFLSQCPRTCRKIGFSLFNVEDKIPADDWDVKLNMVITPFGVVNIDPLATSAAA
jgi:5-formyltetrahydrofolate cyclo-ligase